MVSSSTGTVSYHDAVLEAGSTHTYQVDAVDAANNTSVISDISDADHRAGSRYHAADRPGHPDGRRKRDLADRSDVGRLRRRREHEPHLPGVP